MPHTARFSRNFLKKEQNLPSETKPRVRETVKETLIRPESGIPLVGPLKGLWKARVGKYRIIYEINEKERAVVFHDIDLRKRVYE
jgi:mRNA interferase RelE/StbE